MKKISVSIISLSKKIRINSFADAADGLILLILVFSFVCYSVFYKKFAKIYVNIPGLDFPVFIGEIILCVCSGLLIIKWYLIRKKFTHVYTFILIYVLFFLLKAFIGYFKFGPLAFRHAAMFYYPFFALIAYEAYQEKFMKPYILLCLFYISGLIGIGTYYNFVYFILGVIFILFLKGWILRFLGVCALIASLGFIFLVYSCRTQLIGHVSAFFIILFSLFFLIRMKNIYKVILLILLITCAGLLLFRFGRSFDIETLVSPQTLFAKMREWDKFIESRKGFVVPAVTSFRLYNPEHKEESSKSEPYFVLNGRTVMPVKLPDDENERKRLLDFIQSRGGELAFWDTKAFNRLPPLEANTTTVKTKAPAVGSKAPAVGSKAPAVGSKAPAVGSKAPAVGSKAPAVDSYKNINNQFILMPFDNKSIDDTIEFVRREKIYGSIAPVFSETYVAKLEQRYSTAIFRLLIWRDMLKELFKGKKFFGFAFGKPLLPESLVISRMAYSEWSRDGWIMAHNTYLELIYRSGIIGVVLLIILFVILFKMFQIFLKARSITGILLFSIIVYWLAVGFVYVTFEMPYAAISFWSIFGLTFAYAYKTVALKIGETNKNFEKG